MYGPESQNFVAVPTMWAVLVQLLCLAAWVVVVWVLPSTVTYFKDHTAHIVFIHCGITVIALVTAWYVQRVHRKVLAAGYITFNQNTSMLRHGIVVLTALSNLVLLALLAVSKDMRRGKEFDEELTDRALLGIRILAILEFICSLAFAITYLYRVRKHNVAQPLPEARKAGSVNNGYQPPNPDNTMMSAASNSTFNQQRANEVIAYLQQREDDLVFQLTTLQQQLDAQTSRPLAAGDDDLEAGAGGGGGDGAGRTTSQHDTAELNDRLKASEEHAAWQQTELRKLTAEAQRLRTALREERRKNDKLQLTLEIEKEANAQAQRVIEGIRNLDASDLSDAGARTSDFGGAGYSPPATSGFGRRPPRP